MGGYSAQGQKLYDEALRVIPGVLAAKERKDAEGMKFLLDQFFKTAFDLGLKERDGWQVLLNASIHWCSRLLDRYADSTDTTIDAVIQKMGTVAALWRSDATDPS